MNRSPSDEHLVRLATAGDRKAYGQLVQRWENAAFATAFSVLRERSDAEDAVQTAFVTAWIRLDQLKDQRSFGAWLRTVVRTKSLELARRQGTVTFISTDSTVELTDQYAFDRDRYESDNRKGDLWDAIGRLPRKYREVIAASLLNDFTRDRLAEYLGLPVSTVKGRIQQARLMLRDYLSEEVKDIPMNTVKEKVETSIARIAREEVDLRIPLGEAKRIVLYSGISSDIEICSTDGNEVRITGTKTSIGHDEDDARRSVQGIRILHDEVENYAETGPHEGEEFRGTHMPSGKPEAIVRTTSRTAHIPKSSAVYFRYTDMFPGVVPNGAAIEGLQDFLGAATRITINREKVDDITLTDNQVNEEVAREFVHNYNYDGVRHGPRGMVHLVVAVPLGTEVVALGSDFSKRLRIWGLQSNTLVSGYGRVVELEDIEGDVRLINATARKACGINGRFMQLDYEMGGSSSKENRASRIYGSSHISGITGELNIDVARVDLDIDGVNGPARIINRWGDTCVAISEHTDGCSLTVESESGDITVALSDKVQETIDLLAHTVAGVIDYSAVGGDFSQVCNDMQLISWTTKSEISSSMNLKDQSAEVTLITRSGTIRVEKPESGS